METKPYNYFICLIIFISIGVLKLQAQTITGTVTGEDNEPLIGATIKVKNSARGVITNENGVYKIDLNGSETTLIYSYVGYETIEESVGGRTEINVVLPEGGALGEVTVTARKVEESLQEVPISVVALQGEDIQRRTILDVQDIVLNTPSFTLDNFGGTKVRPSVRGLGSENTSPGQDFSTAVFLDGIYLSTNGMAAVDIFDVERVETLKGPQGTVWGKNVIGGGVNVVPNKPVFGNTARISATLGNYGLTILDGFINFTTSDRVAHRIAANIKSNDGYAMNRTTGNRIDDIDRRSFRYSVAIFPTSNFDINLTVDYNRDRAAGKNTRVFEGPGNNVGYQYLLNNFGSSSFGEREEFSDSDENTDKETYGARLQLRWDLGSVNLTSVTAYREIEDGYLETYNQFSQAQFLEAAQATNSSIFSIGIGDEVQASQISTELRADGNHDALNWSAGVFYSRENGQQDFFVPIKIYSPTLDAMDNVIGSSELFLNRIFQPNNVADDFGIFGELDWTITDGLVLTGGVRYNSNSKDYESTYTQSGVEVYSVDLNDSWEAITWRAALKYQISDETMVYASAATGFKPGGYAALATDERIAQQPLDEETTLAYEIGTKLDLADNRLRINFAAFTSDYEGLQIVTIQQDAATTNNVESATISGIEAEVQAAITQNLFAEVRYAYIDTDVDGFPSTDNDGNPTELDNLRLLRVPEHDVTFNLRYRQSLQDKGFVEASGSFSYRTDVFDNQLNTEFEKRKAFGLFDAYISWDSQDALWGVKLWGKNLANEVYSLNSFGSQGAFAGVLGAPRTFGVTLTRYFR